MKTVFIAVSAAVIAIAVIAFFGSALLYRTAILRRKKQKRPGRGSGIPGEYLPQIESGTAWFYSKEAENVYILSRDGLHLHASLTPLSRGTRLCNFSTWLPWKCGTGFFLHLKILS